MGGGEWGEAALIDQRVVLPSGGDLNRLEKWVDRNLLKFNKKWTILHQGRNKLGSQYVLGDTQLEMQKRPWRSWWI